MTPPTPLDAIKAVKEDDNTVLRTRTPAGETIDCACLPIVGVEGHVWVQMHDSELEGHPVTETAVTNLATAVDPDYEVIDERESLFEVAR